MAMSKSASIMCDRLLAFSARNIGVYARFANRIEEFWMPMMPSDEDDEMLPDFEATGTTTCDDPTEPGMTIDCCTYDMKMRFAYRILALEQDAMQLEHPIKAGATTRFFWLGEALPKDDIDFAPPPSRKRKRANKISVPSIKVAFYYAPDPNPEATVHIVSSIATLLRKNINEYPAQQGFPYSDISKNKMWDKVGKIGRGKRTGEERPHPAAAISFFHTTWTRLVSLVGTWVS
jgi:hypothetical protein